MISIILPTYCPNSDVEKKLLACIASIRLETVSEYELIVVEQGQRVFGHQRPCSYAAYMHLPKPVGFARAVNLGVAAATSEWLFIVNNDIVVPYDWDGRLIQAYRSLPRGGLLSPSESVLKSPRCTSLDAVMHDISWWSCVLIRKDIWTEVGQLDEENLAFRLHDQDWSIRCKRAGYAVARYCGVEVIHDESSTYRHMQVNEQPEREVMRNRWGYEHFCDWVRNTNVGRAGA